ncbi:major facilitator superfamily domain-containing protein [Trichoderma chlorosporum]
MNFRQINGPRLRENARWLYHESGIRSVHITGRDAWLIILARTCRMFAFGGASLIMALFFTNLGFTDPQLGLFMSMTLAGDTILSFVLTFMADSLGRRRVFFGAGLLMAISGQVFVYFDNFWILLLAAVIGVVSANGGDFGPFRAIEESVLSHLTTPETRSDVLSWYVVTSSLGSAIGTEVAGRVVEALKKRDGWSDSQVYHAVFLGYVFMGALNMVFAAFMTDNCEITKPAPSMNEGVQITQGLLSSSDEEADDELVPPTTEPPQKKSRFAEISSATRSIMYKLWFLLAVDCLADGMVSYTLTNYYLDRKFHLPKSQLGDLMSTNYILGSISTVFAGPLARHLGLVNTMVFTHLPSSVAVLFFPVPQGIVLTVILLFIRGGLNNMDQAPRAAFIAAVVKPEERTAVMGVTSTLRTLAALLGPSITGALADTGKFWVAFVAAGALRVAYDLGLWAMFVNVKLHEHEGGPDANKARRVADEEE